jgi:hypothetical protein
MKTLKKILKAFGLILLILMALTGIGFIGAIFQSRERYRDKEIRIEMVDKIKGEDQNTIEQIQVKE